MTEALATADLHTGSVTAVRAFHGVVRPGNSGDCRDQPTSSSYRGGRRRSDAARLAPLAQAVESEGDVAGRLKAPRRLLLKAVAQHAHGLLGQLGIRFDRRQRIVGEDRRQRVDCRGTVERPASGEHLVDDATQSEQIGARVDR